MCESTTGVTHAAEMCTGESVLDSLSLPEDIGCKTAQLLLEEVLKVCPVVCLVYSFSYWNIILLHGPFQGGCAASLNQCLVLLFMALGQRDVSKVQLGELTEYT